MKQNTNIKMRRQEVLNKRLSYLINNPGAFKGNTKERNQYIAFMLENDYTFSDYQKSLCIGMLLSDASFDVNFNNNSARIKTQQRTGHGPWLVNVKKGLLEFTASDKGLEPIAQDRDMIELDTLKCPYFLEFLQFFHSKDEINSGNLGPKGITSLIQPWINPVTVANWFCGDGGRADFTANQGKGITFNTQGFKQEECQILCDALRENLGIIAYTKRDGGGVPIQYRIDTEGASYDRFIEVVGPYIHPCFKRKLPSPRTSRSRFSYITRQLFDACVSSQLNIPEIVEDWKG